MKIDSNTSNQDISITLPLRIYLKAIENLMKKKFIGTNISKTHANGKVSNYFKIIDISLAKSEAIPYNLTLKMKLQTLTRLFNDKDLEVSVHVNLQLDISTQKLYIEAYHINSHGNNWLANKILNSVLNTFIYKKMINSLSVDLNPLLKEKIDTLNLKLGSKLKATKGISIIGTVDKVFINQFKIKENKIWVFVTTSGWCVIDVEHLELEQL